MTSSELRAFGVIGVNRRSYPNCTEDGNWTRTSVLIVLYTGGPGSIDYAAYVGLGEPEHVARHGDKITFDEACIHFPGGQLERSRYRD